MAYPLTAHRTTHPIVDSEGRVIGLLTGHPQDAAGWLKVSKEAAEAIENSRANCTFTPEQKHHHRGAFPALPFSIYHGNGTQVSFCCASPRPAYPTSACRPQVTSTTARMLESWQTSSRRTASCGSQGIQKVHASPRCEGAWRLPSVDIFQVYFPRMYSCYQKSLDELTQRDPTLRRNFAGTPFAAGSINFGPKTECYPHRDWGNVSWGECVIAVLGEYDADVGGHLAFWDLGLVVRFPPGSLIFLPSALVRHSNTPVAPHEHRYSFAQYTPGGLLRWVGHGFKPVPKGKELDEVQRKRWSDGLGMFSMLSEL